MHRWDRLKEFSDDSFKNVSFWIHMGGLQMECYMKELGKKTVDHFEDPQDIQIQDRTKEEEVHSFEARVRSM